MIYKAKTKNHEYTEKRQFHLNWYCMWVVGLSVKPMKTTGKSLKAIQNYTRATHHAIKACREHSKNITHKQIGDYLFKLIHENGYGEHTHNLHTAIKYFYIPLLNDTGKNLAQAKKSTPQKIFEFLSKKEQVRLFSAEKKLYNRLLKKAVRAFGMRDHRKVEIQLSDFDFERNLLYINRDKKALMGHECIRPTERYTKVSCKHISNFRSPLDKVKYFEKNDIHYKSELVKHSNSTKANFLEYQTINQTTNQPANKHTYISRYTRNLVNSACTEIRGVV